MEQRRLLAVTPTGGNFRVNSTAAFNQIDPAFAMDADGDSIVVWTSEEAGGPVVRSQRFSADGDFVGDEVLVASGREPSVTIEPDGAFVIAYSRQGTIAEGYEIFARRFTALGGAVGGEIHVNSTTSGAQLAPAIAMDDAGDFVVVWQGQTAPTLFEIFGQSFNLSGARRGSEFQVSDGTALGGSALPALDMNRSGEFVVAWQSQDGGLLVEAQVYGSDGLPRGGNLEVNSLAPAEAPAVAIDPVGNFVVSWQGKSAEGPGIVARRFDDVGGPLGDEILVSLATAESPADAAIAMDEAGRFAIVWTEAVPAAPAERGILGRCFLADGSATGDPFPIDEPGGASAGPAIAIDADGEFAVAWEHPATATNIDIVAQRFRRTLERPVNATVADRQEKPHVGVTREGDSIVVWQSLGQDDPDGEFGIYAQRFNAAGDPVGSEFRVNETLPGSQAFPVVGIHTSRDALFVWEHTNGDGTADIRARQLSRSGVFSPEFVLNQTTAGDQTSPDLAMDESGNWVVVWQGDDGEGAGVFARQGNLVGGLFAEFRVNESTLGNQSAPRVGQNAPSGAQYLVVWESDGGTPGQSRVWGRHFQGTAPPTEFPVYPGGAGNQESPVVARGFDARSVIVWTDESADGDGRGILAQSFTADGTRDGDIFQVNTTTVGDQFAPDIARNRDGHFVVTWQMTGADGDGLGVLAQAFTKRGVQFGEEIAVNLSTAGDQSDPSLAIDSGDDFLIAWQGPDPDSTGVFVRKFELSVPAEIEPQGEFQVNHSTTGDQALPVVAADRNGNFVVVWASPEADAPASRDILFRLHDAEGLALGPETRVHASSVGDQGYADVAMDRDGRFVVAWQSETAGGGSAIFARRYSRLGAPLSDEFAVDTSPSGLKLLPSVAIQPADIGPRAFVIAWESAGQDGSGAGVYARRFDLDTGASAGNEFLVNQTTLGDQRLPDVAINNLAEAFVVWTSADANGDGIVARRFGPGGPLGDEFVVNLTTAGAQQAARTAAQRETFLVAWESVGQDGSGAGIVFRHGIGGILPSGEILVNTTVAGNQFGLDIASFGNSGSVIAWTSEAQDGSGLGSFGRRFNAAGRPEGGEFRLAEEFAGDQRRPRVAINDELEVVAAWESAEQDGDGSGVFARHFLLRTLVTQSTVGFHNRAAGRFFLRFENSAGPADANFAYGPAGGTLAVVSGDFNNDDLDSIGLYNPAQGAWFLRNTNSTGFADQLFHYGPAGGALTPLAGDWDGDGDDTIGLYDPASGVFFLRNLSSSGAAHVTFTFGPGGAGLIPLVGDWDGDGDDTIGLYGPTGGVFFLNNTNAAGAADVTFNYGPGGNDFTPLVGDWDSDGDDGPGVYRKSSGVFFLKNQAAAGPADVAFNYGPPGSGWQPLAGDWDGAQIETLRLAAPAVLGSAAPALTVADATPLLDEALARWATSDLALSRPRSNAGRIAAADPFDPRFVDELVIEIADLPGNLLGLTDGRKIVLDRNAAGHGWFVDSTPALDDEYESANGRLLAMDQVFESGSVDLLSVLVHELGHLLGRGHSGEGAMSATLAAGARTAIPTSSSR